MIITMLKVILGKTWQYIVIAGLCLAVWHTGTQVERYKQATNTLENTINDLNQEIKQTQICLDDTIKVYQAEVNNLIVTKDNLQAKYNKLLSASKLKPKDVSSVTEITSVTHSVDTVYAEVDSFGGLQARLEDHFVSIGVDVLPDRKTIIDYEVRDSLTVINVQKKHSWLFGLIKWTEHKSTRVVSNNPKSSIVGLQTIEVFEK